MINQKRKLKEYSDVAKDMNSKQVPLNNNNNNSNNTMSEPKINNSVNTPKRTNALHSQDNSFNNVNGGSGNNETNKKPTYQDYKDYINGYYKEKEDYLNKIKEELKYGSYKDLQNANIASELAKEQAMKYYSNTNKANGFGSQGYAQSDALRQYANYARDLNNNRNQFNERNSEIDSQYMEDMNNIKDAKYNEYLNYMKQEDAYNKELEATQIDNIIQNIQIMGGDNEKVNAYLQEIGVMDANGNLTDKYSRYNDLIQETIVGVKHSETSSSKPEYLGEVKRIGGDYEFYAYNKEGKRDKAKWFDSEYQVFQEMLMSANYKNTYVNIRNGEGENVYIYIDEAGNPYYVSPQDFAKNAKYENSYYIVGTDKNVYQGVLQ